MTHGRLQFKTAGPTCAYCGQPKMSCYSDPCSGVLGHTADILLRAELQPSPRPKPVPLIKGGQGRRRAEVEAYANTVCILAMACVVVGILMFVGMR